MAKRLTPFTDVVTMKKSHGHKNRLMKDKRGEMINKQEAEGMMGQSIP